MFKIIFYDLFHVRWKLVIFLKKYLKTFLINFHSLLSPRFNNSSRCFSRKLWCNGTKANEKWKKLNWNSYFGLSWDKKKKKTTTIHHSRSQTCYFTLFYVLTFAFVALTWKMFFSSSSYISLYILGSCKQFVRFSLCFSLFLKKRVERNEHRANKYSFCWHYVTGRCMHATYAPAL